MAKQAENQLTKIMLRNDTAVNWTLANPVLLKGEMGIETDSRKFKVGDGVAIWSALAYASAQAAEVKTAAPTATDSGLDIGTVWINTTAKTAYILISNAPNAAVWSQLKTATCDVTSVNGQKGAVVLTTANIAEGTNLYYTQARFDAAIAAKSTTNLKEGTNLYFTDARIVAYLENPDNIFVLNGGNAVGN